MALKAMLSMRLCESSNCVHNMNSVVAIILFIIQVYYNSLNYDKKCTIQRFDGYIAPALGFFHKFCRFPLLPYISNGKIITMKKGNILFVLPLLFAGCNNIFEEQLSVYDDARENVVEVKEFESLVDNVIEMEIKIAGMLAAHTVEADEELQESLGDEYFIMQDSVYAVRRAYYSVADSMFASFTGHFVEKRIVLYKKAIQYYNKVKSADELVAADEAVKRFSAMAYVDGQRLCDPPQTIRHEYDSIKAAANECYEKVLQRLNE